MTLTRIPSQEPRLRLFWGAQLSSASLLTALAWWLPELVPLEPIAAAQRPVLLLGIASVPLFILAARFLRARQPRSDVRTRDPLSSQPTSVGTGNSTRYLIALTLAELPAIFGLVLSLTGGDRIQAVMLGLAAILSILTLYPRGAGASGP